MLSHNSPTQQRVRAAHYPPLRSRSEQAMTSSAQTLSVERRLRMYEAREAILSRIGSETFSVINLDLFLQATVNQVGKMMEVDRCDVMTLTPDGELRITHEYRAEDVADSVPSSLGLRVAV